MSMAAALTLLAALQTVAMTGPAPLVPDIQLDNPRLQTVHWENGAEVLLTIVPTTGVTVMLEPGETIQRVSVSDQYAFEVRVSPEGNSFLVLANPSATAGHMQVETDRRTYPFVLRTGAGLLAAYLVQFTYDGSDGGVPATTSQPEADDGPSQRWSYRIRGDSEVVPLAVSDDSRRTFITYAKDQALPAVFAIGQTGEEEIVNGYMRDDVFVIDRVYAELVFRLDDEHANARRNSSPDGDG